MLLLMLMATMMIKMFKMVILTTVMLMMVKMMFDVTMTRHIVNKI